MSPLSYDALVDKLEGLIGEIVDTGGQRERTRAYFGIEVLANSGSVAPTPPANFVRVRLEGVAQLAHYFGSEPSVADIVDVLMIAETTPVIFLNRTFGPMGPHDLLDNHVHPDTAVASPLQGSLVVADATPEWNDLVHPAAAGYALTTTATDTVWDQTPDWSGLHTFDAGGLVGTGQDWDPEDASGQNLGDATHRWDLYTQEVYFNGATGANFVSLTDNLADAFHILDAGAGDIYLQIVTTTNGEEVIFNAGADDVDFTVQAVGVADAFQVQGSDGQITLGVLTAGYVKSSAGGVLSVALEVPLADLGNYTQGDLIYGGAADWQDLAHPGAANRVLQSTVAEVGWSAQAVTFPAAGAVPVGTGGANQVAYWTGANALAGDAGLLVDAANDMYIVADAGGIGNAVGTARLMFDSSGATDYASLMGAFLGVNTLGPDRTLDVLHATDPQLRLTQADGTKYVDFKATNAGRLQILPQAGGTLDVEETILRYISTSATYARFEIQPSGGQKWDFGLVNHATEFRMVDGTNGTYPFKIQANTPDNTLFLQAVTGNIGFGTATPDAKHQVVGDSKVGDDDTNYTTIGTTGDVTFVGGAGLAYGSMYTNINIAMAIGTATWVEVDAAQPWTTGKVHNCSFVDPKITVTDAGTYFITYDLTILSSLNNKHIETGIMIDSDPTDGPAHGNPGVQNEGRTHTELVASTNEMTVSGRATIQLAASRTVSLAVRNVDAGDPTVTVSHGNLVVTQIAGVIA